jgi:hypothetical protein
MLNQTLNPNQNYLQPHNENQSQALKLVNQSQGQIHQIQAPPGLVGAPTSASPPLSSPWSLPTGMGLGDSATVDTARAVTASSPPPVPSVAPGVGNISGIAGSNGTKDAAPSSMVQVGYPGSPAKEGDGNVPIPIETPEERKKRMARLRQQRRRKRARHDSQSPPASPIRAPIRDDDVKAKNAADTSVPPQASGMPYIPADQAGQIVHFEHGSGSGQTIQDAQGKQVPNDEQRRQRQIQLVQPGLNGNRGDGRDNAASDPGAHEEAGDGQGKEYGLETAEERRKRLARLRQQKRRVRLRSGSGGSADAPNDDEPKSGEDDNTAAAAWDEGFGSEAAARFAVEDAVKLLRAHVDRKLVPSQRRYVVQQGVLALAAGDAYLRGLVLGGGSAGKD